MDLYTLITKVANVIIWRTHERSAKKFFEFALTEQCRALE